VDTAILHVEQEMVAKSKIPTLHAIARLWEIQSNNLYGVMAVTEKLIKDKPDAVKAFVKGHIEATRLIYTDRAKVVPIMVKYTKLPIDVVNKALDFMVEKCIWDPNYGLGEKRVNFTAELMTKVGNIPQGKTPKYEDLVDLSFAKDSLKELGDYKGPCQSQD
jgi:ABC-type nitrate/sulfonate/bicarbonate transport system substrate-binding protein